jgi:hypothetical protein
MRNPKILFLLKKNSLYGNPNAPTSKSGLFNSATITAEQLNNEGLATCSVLTVIDGNSIDRELYNSRPDIAVIEAIWVTPHKLEQVQKLHPNVTFIVRIHSEIPFLANEGVALERIKGYLEVKDTYVAFNSENTYRDFSKVFGGSGLLYLPNIYLKIPEFTKQYKYSIESLKASRRLAQAKAKTQVNIGCFGAIRPMKNQLIQGFAAIEFANKYNLQLNFHINGGRIEQGGEPVLKNIRELFKDSQHNLFEWGWLDREDFLNKLKGMHVSLQISHNESFNIVTADSLLVGTPVVVSETIDWLPNFVKADVEDTADMVEKIERAIVFDKYSVSLCRNFLNQYNKDAINKWKKVLKHL